MRVLVTGGTGYLGRAVVRAFTAAGHEPVVVSRSVWCSISAFTSAPRSTMKAESQSHMRRMMTAPSDP